MAQHLSQAPPGREGDDGKFVGHDFILSIDGNLQFFQPGLQADLIGGSPDNPDILATSYLKSGRALISLASWSPGPAMARLKVNWKALGLDPAKAQLRAPAIPEVQFATTFALDDPIPFEPGKGWILILEEKK